MGLIGDFFGRMKLDLIDASHGELELWKTFWVIGILGHFSVFLIKWFLVTVWPGMGEQIGYGIVFAFSVYWLYLIWRCAMNVEILVWFFIARMYVVLALVVLVLKFFKIFFI